MTEVFIVKQRIEIDKYHVTLSVGPRSHTASGWKVEKILNVENSLMSKVGISKNKEETKMIICFKLALCQPRRECCI